MTPPIFLALSAVAAELAKTEGTRVRLPQLESGWALQHSLIDNKDMNLITHRLQLGEGAVSGLQALHTALQLHKPGLAGQLFAWYLCSVGHAPS